MSDAPLDKSPWIAPRLAPPEPPKPKRKLRKIPIIIAAIMGVLLIVAILGALGDHGNPSNATSGSSDPTIVAPPPGDPNMFSAEGTINLNDSTGKNTSVTDATCVGVGAYADLAAGTQVVVADENGSTVALGKLDPGESWTGKCVFTFDVQNVPIGKTFYRVTIGNLPPIQGSESDIETGALKWTVGS